MTPTVGQVNRMLRPMPCSQMAEMRVPVNGTDYWVRWWHHGPMTLCMIVWQRAGAHKPEGTWSWAWCHPRDVYDAAIGRRVSMRRASGVETEAAYMSAGEGAWKANALGADGRALYDAIRAQQYQAGIAACEAESLCGAGDQRSAEYAELYHRLRDHGLRDGEAARAVDDVLRAELEERTAGG